jgi:hypothetical protein
MGIMIQSNNPSAPIPSFPWYHSLKHPNTLRNKHKHIIARSSICGRILSACEACKLFQLHQCLVILDHNHRVVRVLVVGQVELV